MLNERIERLMEAGCCEKLAILVEWDSINKRNLPLDKLYWLWNRMSSGTHEKAEVLKLIEEKSETLGELQWLWMQTSPGTSEQAKILNLIREKTKALHE